MGTRNAGKAGSWYVASPDELDRELDDYLSEVPDTVDGSSLPIKGARIVIAPHAGYTFSGPCAAWAYKCLDLSKAKRVFVLGPSHTYYLDGCAVTTYGKYATPFGNLTVDRDVIQRVKEAGQMDDIPKPRDSAEHSLEMHLPYLYKRCEQTFGSPDKFPTIVPILIGDNNRDEEKNVGRILGPYLKDEENAFIISSDFCHWGAHFQYMVYSPENNPSKLTKLSRVDKKPVGPPIHETIRLLDEAAMDAVKSGSHDAFIDNLQQTKNTVCGRHPIGVAMAALEILAKEANDDKKCRFKITQYQRSNLVDKPSDFSVSYVSAYAVL
ncbi:hypothetical protein QQS21_004814 [Conoideocrella luteorostrata]|uniref:Uncharacterized protein n=1 Tax=Conoideocrella luteorostrata TaxID=1105319 RepID=A0AAJ0FUD2_9HYPO|nr:hypothetical protein QQS21_004814 [Conoideocrella luteorostrata]